MKRFFIQTSILTAIFLIAGYLLYSRIIPDHYTPVLPCLLLFIFFATNIVYRWLFTTLKKNSRKFTSVFMGASFIKMLVYLLVGIGLAWFHREHGKVILLNFLIMYIAYSVLEVIALVRLVRRNS